MYFYNVLSFSNLVIHDILELTKVKGGVLMKKFLKILLRILIVGVLFIAAVFVIRWINSYRYRDYMLPDEESIFDNPADFSLYDLDVEGIEVDTIEEGRLNGFHFKPEEMESEGVIVTFGGSEGSSNFDLAQLIAEEGYEVYSLFFFGPGDLPDELIEVPLELFEDFLAYHSDNSETEGPITVLGASKGAELTLNLASRYDEIDQIVLYTPAAYSFFSLDMSNSNESSWSYQDESVPYLSSTDGSMWETMKMIGGFIFYYPVEYYPVYTSVIEGSAEEDLENARIKVEDFEGETLVIAGEDDLMWPASEMTDNIEEHAEQIDVHLYPEAGHLFIMDRYMATPGAIIGMGGNQEANSQANEDSTLMLFDKLSEWHR